MNQSGFEDMDAEAHQRSQQGPTAGNAPAEMDPSLICTCVVEDGPKICFASYNGETNQIILELSRANAYETQNLVERQMSFVRPNLLLLHNRIIANEELLQVLTKPLPQVAVDNDGQPGSGAGDASARADQTRAVGMMTGNIPYRTLKSGTFDYRTCMDLILQKLRVMSLIKQNQARNYPVAGVWGNFAPPGGGTMNPRFGVGSYHSLSALIDFDSPLEVQAVGALLSFLQSTEFRFEDGGTVTVADVVRSQSSMLMSINASTLAALQIFSTEYHPLVAAKGRGNSKEGSSLFSLLDRTKSSGGRQMLRDWMLKPLRDREAIMQRQDGVEIFVSENFTSQLGLILNLMKDIGPIDKIIARLQKCTANPKDFLSLNRTVSAAKMIYDVLVNEIQGPLLQATNNQSPQEARQDQTFHRYIAFLQHILELCNVQILEKVGEQIESVVDEDSTNQGQGVVVREGYCEELDICKEQYKNLHETLQGKRNMIAERHPDLDDLGVVFLPQLGYFVSCGQQHNIPGDWKHAFSSEGTCYCKTQEMVELDEGIGDLESMIEDKEKMIVGELEESILDSEIELRRTFGALAELDCILSFAICAQDLGFTRPVLLGDSPGIVNILNGRHPLQEILVENGMFIPNNTNIDPDKRVNVITGPNFSGKSCYARQVGVLVYMAHIGCFLPCDEARISIFDQIIAHFSTVETGAVPQSSFQLDLSSMGNILRRGTPRSLALIDEFGKGTSPASGIALLTAALKKLASLNCSAVCTTHFLEMFSHGLLRDGENGIKAMQMAVSMPTDQREFAAPMFKLAPGVADSSAGIACAELAGLDRDVIQRAAEIVQALKQGSKLQPCEDVFRVTTTKVLTPVVKDTLRTFFSQNSWADATDEQVAMLLEKIAVSCPPSLPS